MSQSNPSSPGAKQYSSLEELFSVMKRMSDDPLAKAGTNIVISRGNPKAKLLIIGEAPGPEENIQGKPFVGRAGQMLDKILQAANFDPEQDVYITNSVFRMPPGEDGKNFRKPTDTETDFYRPYVFEIIRLIDPFVMLLTGNVASYSILRKTGITSLRGKWTELQGRWIMPIFHPSYLLRNPSKEPGSPKAQMWDDIREVRKKYDELTGKTAAS
ncbi:uracil-DNA glycosylase [Candidatus Villigracilis affinis]|uniref:uracil-DNA glycosylase n=1 Tax=Candidatus Villigracilis affinis TaxID=3140682 RepID=UPI001B3CE813|nr:uracil-DNA glycosylase [Anaerolineales bacterium]MBP8048272.1 uracil-DNA glycosylase [Anaerolineales bacterium]